MKYIVELTAKQKAQMECIMEIVHRYVGFNPKLEPTETTNVKDHQEYYDRGYTQAIADYRKFERFFNSVGGIEVFEDIRNTDGTLSTDMILQYLPMPEIMARIKAYEEKKKAEEEIKVGDIVIHKDDKIKGVVYRVEDGLAYGTNCYLNSFEWATNLCTKVGHIDEMKTLLDKLRGEENE